MSDILAASVAEWLDFMSDTVTIYAWTGFASATGATYSPTGTTYPCYIEMKNHLIVDAQGREVMARGKVFMGTNVVVGVKDKVVLPAEYVPLSPPILAINVANDELGNHHTTLEIG